MALSKDQNRGKGDCEEMDSSNTGSIKKKNERRED